MKKFKKVILNSIAIFIISSLIHSLYNLLPNPITLIFLPVNESIFEHQKMIFTSFILLLIIKSVFQKKKEKLYIASYFLSGLINIVIFLIMYLPIYSIFGEKMIITLIIYFISIVLTYYIKLYIDSIKINKKTDNLFIIGIALVYLVFTYLTYYPLNISIFHDKTNKMHGIYKLYS